jgi:hypothetical protein
MGLSPPLSIAREERWFENPAPYIEIRRLASQSIHPLIAVGHAPTQGDYLLISAICLWGVHPRRDFMALPDNFLLQPGRQFDALRRFL